MTIKAEFSPETVAQEIAGLKDWNFSDPPKEIWEKACVIAWTEILELIVEESDFMLSQEKDGKIHICFFLMDNCEIIGTCDLSKLIESETVGPGPHELIEYLRKCIERLEAKIQARSK